MRLILLFFSLLPLGCFCQAEPDVEQEIVAMDTFLFWLPNVCTPDCDHYPCDEFNPTFAQGTNVTNYSFKIFNRWGINVFESTNPKEKFLCGTQEEDGVYFWVLKFSLDGSDIEEHKGQVTILK